MTNPIRCARAVFLALLLIPATQLLAATYVADPPFAVNLSCSVTPTAPTSTAPDRQRQLLHAVVQDQVDVVRTLLTQGGVDPNVRTAPDPEDAWAIQGHGDDDDPAPPLIVLACRFGSIQGPEVIRLLLDHGADVNRADRAGVTPLMAAAELGMGSVSLLLERGAKVDARDRQGRTALMYAMGNLGLSATASLLAKGADVKARDQAGETALTYAIRRAEHDPILLIGEDQVKKAKAEKARYIELVRFLITRGPDVNARTASGETALSIARAQHQEEVVALLRAAGARG